MQIPELFRRGLVVPETDEAETELRSWNVSKCAKVRYLPIEGDALFLSLWKAGLFRAINRACGTNIDDYEEEVLEPDMLERAILAVKQVLGEVHEPSVRQFIEKLSPFLEDAARMEKPVFVVL
jgi:hypothetical protein